MTGLCAGRTAVMTGLCAGRTAIMTGLCAGGALLHILGVQLCRLSVTALYRRCSLCAELLRMPLWLYMEDASSSRPHMVPHGMTPVPPGPTCK
eukprot:CAMPEP_0202894564 /NCGR_PEP_ID=MMETSP1392-20130828/3950_1 /ASSEMBLY_ACC=CAM_ASM_000868 /TAXON_ID=225041 /ORGANISM="Chlamydomonas chlamydogama, Strain SAG 11-48b" /LENGTH=92 /DNA_ID=CAMNT_0049579299 /DNA_START=15 /DNA_END=294 /DNA_ORIENTATION=-